MSISLDYPEYLKMMLTEARLAQEFVAGVEYESFLANREKQCAVIYSIEAVGEGARNIPDAICEKYPQIGWGELVAMGDGLLEDYKNVKLEAVWETARERMPRLAGEVEGILRDVDSGK